MRFIDGFNSGGSTVIIVTGTKRSGTSMWMQVMRDAGLKVIGEAFPKLWEETIRDANPHGFYESPLRRGINFTTNPHPKTGVYLPHDATRLHAVKVFIPGLVRSDIAFIHRVVASMRPWDQYVRSLTRLYDMEDARLTEMRGSDHTPMLRMPPLLEWWDENHSLIRDAIVRRYPIHFVSYDAMLRDPARVVRDVFKWVGTGDAEAAAAAVKPETRTQTGEFAAERPPHADVFDELYALVDSGAALTAPMIEKLNAVNEELHPQVEQARAEVRKAAMRRRAAAAAAARTGSASARSADPPDPAREPHD